MTRKSRLVVLILSSAHVPNTRVGNGARRITSGSQRSAVPGPIGVRRCPRNANAHLPRRQVQVEVRITANAAAVSCSGWLSAVAHMVVNRQGASKLLCFQEILSTFHSVMRNAE